MQYIGVDCMNAGRLEAVNDLLYYCKMWKEQDGFQPDPLDGEQKGYTPTFYVDYSNRCICVRGAKPVTSFPPMLLVVLKTPERAEDFGNTFIDLFNKWILDADIPLESSLAYGGQQV
ncbi:MAG: hypothetical protein LUB83_00095 [Prevotellaceae bacterium]|nr:hypothetical protein [Prevotellaceae bacterium]